MSMYSSFSNAVQRTFNAIGATAESVEKGVSNANTFIDQHTKANERIIQKQAISRVAKHHRSLQKELEQDEELAALFEEIEADW